jgi:hypothetical protein
MTDYERITANPHFDMLMSVHRVKTAQPPLAPAPRGWFVLLCERSLAYQHVG